MQHFIEGANPYANVYNSIGININAATSPLQAEQLARQLGLLHNTLGLALKDFIKLLSFKFTPDNLPQYQNSEYQHHLQQSKEVLHQQQSKEVLHQQQSNLSNNMPLFEKPEQSNLHCQANNSNSNAFEICIDEEVSYTVAKNGVDSQNGNMAANSESSIICQEELNHKKDHLNLNEGPQGSRHNGSNIFNVDNFKFTPYSQKVTSLPEINEEHKPFSDGAYRQKKGIIKEKARGNNQIINIVEIRDDDEEEKFEQGKESERYQEFQAMRLDVGRNKKARQRLPGISCPDCKGFYNAIGDKGQCCESNSRHRSNHQIAPQKQNFSEQKDFQLD